jgi:hypothetical protein
MLVIVTIFVAGLEYYWRSRGFVPSYNDDKVLWATQRKNVYEPKGLVTVFVGGSRIKFDLDIPTWEKLTGEKAVQLALVGTPGRLTLRDLANDENFKGKLIIDVTETQFFSIDTVRRDKSARESIEYYYKETLAQKASASIDYVLESKLVFLEEGRFGLNALLNTMPLTNRPGVVPPPPCPPELSTTDFRRQTSLTPMFLADPQLQKKQIAIWTRIPLYRSFLKGGDTLAAFCKGIKASIDKIRSRGGMVIFVRPPSSGNVLENEKKFFPRQLYWDRLLEYTNTAGIHFSDHPAIANLICPEWSHLAPADGVKFTTSLVEILQREKGWSFPNSTKLNSTH